MQELQFPRDLTEIQELKQNISMPLPSNLVLALIAAGSGFWEGERASEGRGCFERGTLNVDRKANRKGAPCAMAFLISRVAEASSETSMIGEGRRNGMIGQEEATSLTDIPNIRQKGSCRLCH
jgi:hypothetical protein